MVGRTHMAIGALGAAIFVPILLHDQNAHAMLVQTGHGALISAEQISSGIGAGALGGLLPDLDHQHAILSRMVARLGQVFLLCALILFFIVFPSWASPIVVVALLIMFFEVVRHVEWMRKVSLLMLASGFLRYGWIHHVWFEVSLFAALWLVVATFSSHRSFTHSLLGLGILNSALNRVGTYLHIPWIMDTALLGYALHLATDAIAGGIPLLWPYRKRNGIRLVKTGSKADHVIGGLGFAGLIALLFV